MKTNFKMLAGGLLLSGLLMVGGCGNDDDVVAKGKVVKGPVVGAIVKDSTGATVGTTDKDGNFPMTGTGPYTSTGGTYIPLKADGTAGTAVAAPPMSCPVGVSQITPISTLVQTAKAAAEKTGATQAEKDAYTNIAAVVTANGGLNVDLSTKTTANTALLTLSETVGAVLATASTTSTAALTAATSALVAEVAKASKTAPITTAAISTAVTAAITTVAATIPTVSAALTAAATTATTGTTAAPIGALPTGTGSTGGSN
jgi:hypothetical protein